MTASNFSTYIERNAQFAATDAKEQVPEIPFIPSRQLYLITCIDPRVEPAAIVGCELGEAIVACNIGGRCPDAALCSGASAHDRERQGRRLRLRSHDGKDHDRRRARLWLTERSPTRPREGQIVTTSPHCSGTSGSSPPAHPRGDRPSAPRPRPGANSNERTAV